MTTLILPREAVILKTKERREVFSESKVKEGLECAPQKAPSDFALPTIAASASRAVPKLNLRELSANASSQNQLGPLKPKKKRNTNHHRLLRPLKSSGLRARVSESESFSSRRAGAHSCKNLHIPRVVRADRDVDTSASAHAAPATCRADPSRA